MSNFFFGIIVKFFKQSAAVSLRLIIITRLNNGIKLVHIADKHGFRRFLFFKFGKQFRQFVIVQFFNREDGGCVISCLRKNFSLLRTILLQARDQLSAKTVKHRSAHKTGTISLNLDIVGNKVGGAEFAQGAQNLFFDCLRILGFRERF